MLSLRRSNPFPPSQPLHRLPPAWPLPLTSWPPPTLLRKPLSIRHLRLPRRRHLRRKLGCPLIPTEVPSAEAGVPPTPTEASSAEAGLPPTPTVEVPPDARDETESELVAIWQENAERSLRASIPDGPWPNPWLDNTAAFPPTSRITIVAVGGFPGAGVRTQVSLSATLMRGRGFTTIEVYTDHYHRPVLSDYCSVCVRHFAKLGRATHTHCNLCPLSFDEAAIIGFVDMFVASQPNNKRIIVFIAGRNILASNAILDKATVLIWMGLQENIGLCTLRHLRAAGVWPAALGEDLTDPRVSSLLAFLTEDTVNGLDRLFAHAHQFETVSGERREMEYIDVAGNTIREVATEFDQIVLDMLSAPLTNVSDAPPYDSACVVPTVGDTRPSAEAGAGSCVGSDLYDLYQ